MLIVKEYADLGALLYDDIPLSTSDNNPYHLPICVFFIRNVKFVNDHVYIFFNKNVTAIEITLIVKHYLGIEDSNDFVIDPPIEVGDHTVHKVEQKEGRRYNLWEFLGDTFVKLSGCGTFNKNYCLETGVFKPNTALFDVATRKHEMTSMKKAVEIKTRNRDQIYDAVNSGFSERISKMRNTVQQDLFKIYIEGLKFEGRLMWENYYIDKQKTKKGGLVYGEDRRLELTYSSMEYLDEHTPKDIVMHIENGLATLNVAIPADISDETMTKAKAASTKAAADAKAAAEAKVAAEAKAAVDAKAAAEEKAAAEARAAAEKTFDTTFSDTKEELKEAIRKISQFTAWMSNWTKKKHYNCHNGYEIETKRKAIDTAFFDEYKTEEQNEIINSLKLCRQTYQSQKKIETNKKIFIDYTYNMVADHWIREPLETYLSFSDSDLKHFNIRVYSNNEELSALWFNVIEDCRDYSSS